MDFDDWAAEHKPQANPAAVDVDEEFVYRADGHDLEYVRGVAERLPLHVWSVVEGDRTAVLSGYADGADAYLVTDEPADPWAVYDVER